jgi:PI-3-kinase-related kinase SMG-1
LACEHVLKSLKKGRETLLTLLEAFVYDPLIEWDYGEDSFTKIGVNQNVTTLDAKNDLKKSKKSSTRFNEIKLDWTQNR